MDEGLPAYAAVITNVIAKPFTPIVPVNQPLDVKSQILARDDVEALIDKAGRYAVTNCTCRTIARKCDKPIEVCLQIGKGAD